MAKHTKRQAKHRNRAEEVARRENRFKLRLSGKQKKIIAIVLAVILVLGIFYGRTIIRLKLENHQLTQQQEELEAEKSRLTKELKNIHSKDYIQEQAREKLLLLNRDEILFKFKDKKND